jgi:hypothetical protein
MPITVITAMGKSDIGHLSDLRRAYPMNIPSLRGCVKSLFRVRRAAAA